MTFGSPNVAQAGIAHENGVLQTLVTAHCSPRSTCWRLQHDMVPMMLSAHAGVVFNTLKEGPRRLFTCCRRKYADGVQTRYAHGDLTTFKSYGPLFEEVYVTLPKVDRLPTRQKPQGRFNQSLSTFRRYTDAMVWRMLMEFKRDEEGIVSSGFRTTAFDEHLPDFVRRSTRSASSVTNMSS